MTCVEYVRLEQRDGVAVLRMVDEAGNNALGEPMTGALLEGLDLVRRNPETRVLVLAGLPDVFCSGASLRMLEDMAAGCGAPTDLLLPRTLLDLPIPVIAAMAGHAIGGGLALGLAAEIALAARESRYGCSTMNMGFTPAMGLTGLMQLVLTPSLASEMMLTGDLLKGRALEGCARLNYILPRAAVEERAMALAQSIAEKPRPALTLLKRALSLPKRQAFETACTVESLMHDVTLHRPETLKLMREYFAVPGG